PVSRGDLATLKLHLQALESHAPQLLPIYKKLGQHAVTLALSGQSLSDDAARQIVNLFSD
ncbi:MAG: DUF2520 domain-containing protein, partial [Planctomycetota bacterium]